MHHRYTSALPSKSLHRNRRQWSIHLAADLLAVHLYLLHHTTLLLGRNDVVVQWRPQEVVSRSDGRQHLAALCRLFCGLLALLARLGESRLWDSRWLRRLRFSCRRLWFSRSRKRNGLWCRGRLRRHRLLRHRRLCRREQLLLPISQTHAHPPKRRRLHHGPTRRLTVVHGHDHRTTSP